MNQKGQMQYVVKVVDLEYMLVEFGKVKLFKIFTYGKA